QTANGRKLTRIETSGIRVDWRPFAVACFRARGTTTSFAPTTLCTTGFQARRKLSPSADPPTSLPSALFPFPSPLTTHQLVTTFIPHPSTYGNPPKNLPSTSK